MSRELDAKVAEKVMGWTPLHDAPSEAWRTQDNEVRTSEPTSFRRFSPSQSCDSDNEVLKHVRENWDARQMREFQVHLASIWASEDEHDPWLLGAKYRPGDYSRAALKALGEEF